jgi:hypothetical protein
MQTKINIAEILKDKLENTKLYSPLFGDVYFYYVGNDLIKVKHHGGRIAVLFDNGRYYDYPESELLLFPSKEMRDWSKFAWKKGDVLINSCGFQCIFKEWASDDYTKFNGCYSCSRDGYEDVSNAETAKFAKFDHNIAYGYVREIERKLGGKLNLETLEIERQPELQDGDIAFADYGNRQNVFIVSGITGLSEGYSSFISLDLSSLTLSMGYRTCFFKKDLCKLRLATDSEKKQLFSALEKESKAWDAENKMVVDLKPKVELKPFDKVLVRDSKLDKWRANLFGYISKNGYYCCVYANWVYCIPYKGNEHMLGTTKDVEG